MWLGGLVVGCMGINSSPRHLVIIEVDGLRSDVLDEDPGDAQVVPNLDALSSVGVRFDAFSPSGSTASAVASLWTGLDPRRHGLATDDHRLSPQATTLAQVLSPAGFHTGLVVGGGFAPSSALARGFDHVDGGEDRLSATAVTDAALGWLTTQKGANGFEDRLYLHAQYSEAIPALREDGHPKTDADRYEMLLQVVDDEVRRLIEGLDEKRLTQNALIVLVSARGASVDPHGDRVDGAASLFDDRLAVPMVVRLPGVDRGRRVKGLVSTTDMVPTVLDALGVGAGPMQGRSAWRAVLNRSGWEPRTVVFAESCEGEADVRPPRWVNDDRWLAARTETHKLLWHPPSGAMELYDLAADPNELWDALDVSSEREVIARNLFTPLHAWWYDDRYPDLSKRP